MPTWLRSPGASRGRYRPVREPLRLERGELLSAGSAVLLLASMFVLAWYGVDGVPGRTAKVTSTENAWSALPLIRWFVLLTAVAAIGSLALHLSQRGHGAKTDTGLLLAALAWLNLVLLIVRVLIDLPSADEVVDQKIGAFVGLAFALALALGATESLREQVAADRALGRAG